MSWENNGEIKRKWFYSMIPYIDQRLGTGDKLIIRNCIDEFIDDYRKKTGFDPSTGVFEVLIFYDRIKQFGYSMYFYDWFKRIGLREAWADYETSHNRKRPKILQLSD